MPLQCPKCKGLWLQVEKSMELGSDERSDEVALQIVHCSVCGFKAVAIYEESRRGTLDDESVHHTAYPADDEALGQVMDIITSCRNPQDASCRCRGHQQARQMLSERSARAGVDWQDPIPIVFVR
ncbi:MAG: hypothetical protein R6V19_11100 [Armatimonadota bacterium]